VGLAALKYGDSSNQASKDYIFDVDRFTSFEGNTGPYILYTIVRIKSILKNYEKVTGSVIENGTIRPYDIESQINLMLEASKFNETIANAYEELAPHKICKYVYDLSDAFNTFYHENKIIAEEDKEKQESWIALIKLVLDILETSINILGFKAPERM
ncbi:MAG: arginine--tRNA ligase, partial [Clostridiales bacterium]|nr:arginine--tRNA ligase [Clostridiales bacterium]